MLYFFLISFTYDDASYTGCFLTDQSKQWDRFRLVESFFDVENRLFCGAYTGTFAWVNPLVYLSYGVFSGNNGQWLIANWNVKTNFPNGSTGALTNFSHSSRDSTTKKRKFNKCRCSHYQNSTATFHLLLKGDLVFKLNPGPTLSNQTQSRGNIHNYVDNLNSRNGSIGSRKLKMLLSCFNARSVRNKTGDIFILFVRIK